MVVAVFLDSRKAFDTASHSTFLEKLSSCGMSRFRVHCVENWLKGRAHRADLGYTWLATAHLGLLLAAAQCEPAGCALAARRANCTLGCLKQHHQLGKKADCPLSSALVQPHLKYLGSSGPHNLRRM